MLMVRVGVEVRASSRPAFMLNTNAMPKSIPVKRKKRGRPATGADPMIGLRLPVATIVALDAWARKEGIATRSEAVRLLIDTAVGIPAGRA
jgi:hypothetical protein